MYGKHPIGERSPRIPGYNYKWKVAQLREKHSSNEEIVNEHPIESQSSLHQYPADLLQTM